MRLIIQGREIKVTLNADRDLTTQEIISAHQLSTGNFEALFVSDFSDTQLTAPDISVTPNESTKHNDGWIEKGTWVEAQVMCPFCGHVGKTGTRWGNSFCKCPKCNEKLFNKFATGVPGEKDSWGCLYLADEPMQFRSQVNEDEKMFNSIDE